MPPRRRRMQERRGRGAQFPAVCHCHEGVLRRTRESLKCARVLAFLRNSVCSSLQDYVTDTYLRQKWMDPRLSHDDIRSPLDLADPNLVKAIWKPVRALALSSSPYFSPSSSRKSTFPMPKKPTFSL